MKRILFVFLVIFILISFAACSSNRNSSEPKSTDFYESGNTSGTEHITDYSGNYTDLLTPTPSPNGSETTSVPIDATNTPEVPTDSHSNYTNPFDSLITINIDSVTSFDELDDLIDNYVTGKVKQLKSLWNSLSSEVDSFDKYCDNSDRVSAFYNTVLNETEQICLSLYEYTAVYSRKVLDSNLSAEKKYKTIDGIKDVIYDEACEDIKKKIYDGILEDIKNYYYDDIIEKARDKVDYSKWDEVSSKEYNQWDEVTSAIYTLYDDTSSDIYSFWNDLSEELYNDNTERADKRYDRFLKKIAKVKNIDLGDSIPDAKFDTTLKSISSLKDFDSVVYDHIYECTVALEKEWEKLSKNIDSFDKFKERSEEIKLFHKHLEDSAYLLFVTICDYGVSYAELIMQSDMSDRDKYNAFDGFYNNIYQDACSVVKESLYDELLREIKMYYYDGIIKAAKDNTDYSTWSSARSDTYRWWSDSRSSIYSDWSDTRSTLYSFRSDIRSELYSGNEEEANQELQKFKKKVDKMKEE